MWGHSHYDDCFGSCPWPGSRCFSYLRQHKRPLNTYAANLLFFANLPPQALVEGGGHLWSLCVEMQFYFGIALLVLAAGRKALYLLPILSLIVTAYRASAGAHIDIVTWRRVDEILAGCILALIYEGWLGEWPQRMLRRTNVYFVLPILFMSAHPSFGALCSQLVRPFTALQSAFDACLRRGLWRTSPRSHMHSTLFTAF
jgi:peptidoglycan/LPS O-acetylase OafA/YrhL